MKKHSIKIVEFYLKNYAPFYESMGLREFYFDKRDSPYNITLIIGFNGSGKSYLITELSPQVLEHIAGRISNRFILGEEGEKRVHFIVNESIEYVCTILFDKNHKTSCFLKQIDLITGESKELNPNGNVSSYQELCQNHLYYNKTFKNVGYISTNVKNVVTMPFIERQQLFSTWLPDTSQFLSATKIIQKKINVTKREIENLITDITKISISSYKENLINLKSNLETIEKGLFFYRDHISKINLLLGSFSKFERELLKEQIHNFKNNIMVYNDKFEKNRELFTQYRSYLSLNGEKKLLEDIGLLKEKKATLEEALNGINDKITMVQNSIGRIRSNEPEMKSGIQEPYDMVSIDSAITQIKNSLKELDSSIADCLDRNSEFSTIVYSLELKNAVKQIITVFLSLFQMASGIIQACNEFTLKDVFDNDSLLLNNYKETIKTLNEQNVLLGDTIETLRKHEAEMSQLSVDESFLAFIPFSCNENTCSLIKELKKHMDFSNFDIQKEIEEKNKIIIQNKEKLMALTLKMNTIENIYKEVTRINQILFDNKDEIVLLPEYLFKKINTPVIHELIGSMNIIIIELQHLDEYLSLLEKKKASAESVQNLINIFKLLKQNDSLNNELMQYIEEDKTLSQKREEVIKELTLVKENINKLSNLSQSISVLITQKEEIENNYTLLLEDKESLLKENTNLYYKKTFQEALSSFKNKEADLIKNGEQVKTEIERCTSMITNRTVLEKRKNIFEEKLRLYELLYAVWNPRTGYPSMLIKDFLDEVTFVTNVSLDNIWGGLIRIKEFQLEESEFRIPIIRGNTILEDITECSTAEKTTLALAISLAIIQISISYNVVRVDEADSGFDELRRQSFLEMITEQLGASGCKDSYLITHNQHFENLPCNVILLKGYEQLVSEATLENKRILYRYPSL
jgi:energy-coupling factor transporter ATP-binding protein EcfA2